MSKSDLPQIIRASRDLMREKGYAATSVQDISARVGLLKGSLYNHIAKKEDLVPYVLDLTMSEICSRRPDTGHWLQDFENFVLSLTEILIENRKCLGLQIAYGADTIGEAGRHAVRQFFDDLRHLFVDILYYGLDGDVAHVLALDCVTYLEGATLWLALSDDSAPIHSAAALLISRARGYADIGLTDDAKRVLDEVIGDWRFASAAERVLAERLAAKTQVSGGGE